MQLKKILAYYVIKYDVSWNKKKEKIFLKHNLKKFTLLIRCFLSYSTEY